MPKSVFEIDVDDRKWQAYIASFNKFRATQKEAVKDWGGMDEAVTAIGAGFVFMTEELGRQAEATRGLAEQEAKRQKAEEGARKERTRAEKEEAQRERESETRRRKAIEDTRTIARNVADTAASLGKWALFDLGAGILTAWGLDRLVSSVGAERRLAQGFGVSTGERQAMSINMSRYFDVNSVLENAAETAADPSRKWVYSAMGVNPAGKDPAVVASEMAIAARRIFLEGHGNEQWAQAHGLLSIFSMDDLRRLAASPEGQLRASARQAAVDAAPGGHAFLDDEVSRKWQDFIVGLDMAGLHLKNVFVTKLASLEGPLSLIITKFVDLGVQVLDRIDFKVLGDGLDKLTEYIGSKQFQQDFKTVVDDIGYAANKLVGAMQVLGLLPDNPTGGTGGGPAPAPVGANPGQGNTTYDNPGGYWTQDFFGGKHYHAPQNPFWDEVQGKVGRLTGGDIAKGSKVAQALQRDLGLGHGAASGIVGNLLAEDPSLVAMNERNPARGRGGFGWAQWTGPRRVEFEQWAAANHLDIHSDEANYGFLVHELKTKFQSLLRKIQHESVGAATADIYRTFEAPRKGDTTLAARVAKAVKVEISVANATGSSVAAQANAASR